MTAPAAARKPRAVKTYSASVRDSRGVLRAERVYKNKRRAFAFVVRELQALYKGSRGTIIVYDADPREYYAWARRTHDVARVV